MTVIRSTILCVLLTLSLLTIGCSGSTSTNLDPSNYDQALDISRGVSNSFSGGNFWPMHGLRSSNKRTASSPSDPVSFDSANKWDFDLAAPAHSTPVLHETLRRYVQSGPKIIHRRIYLIDEDSNLVCLDRDNRSLVWSKAMVEGEPQSFTGSSPLAFETLVPMTPGGMFEPIINPTWVFAVNESGTAFLVKDKGNRGDGSGDIVVRDWNLVAETDINAFNWDYSLGSPVMDSVYDVQHKETTVTAIVPGHSDTTDDCLFICTFIFQEDPKKNPKQPILIDASFDVVRAQSSLVGIGAAAGGPPLQITSTPSLNTTSNVAYVVQACEINGASQATLAAYSYDPATRPIGYIAEAQTGGMMSIIYQFGYYPLHSSADFGTVIPPVVDNDDIYLSSPNGVTKYQVQDDGTIFSITPSTALRAGNPVPTPFFIQATRANDVDTWQIAAQPVFFSGSSDDEWLFATIQTSSDSAQWRINCFEVNLTDFPDFGDNNWEPEWECYLGAVNDQPYSQPFTSKTASQDPIIWVGTETKLHAFQPYAGGWQAEAPLNSLNLNCETSRSSASHTPASTSMPFTSEAAYICSELQGDDGKFTMFDTSGVGSHMIQGTVTVKDPVADVENPFPGVLVEFHVDSGDEMITFNSVTDHEGVYTIFAPHGSSGDVKPRKQEFFDGPYPESRSIESLEEDLTTDMDFEFRIPGAVIDLGDGYPEIMEIAIGGDEDGNTLVAWIQRDASVDSVKLCKMSEDTSTTTTVDSLEAETNFYGTNVVPTACNLSIAFSRHMEVIDDVETEVATYGVLYNRYGVHEAGSIKKTKRATFGYIDADGVGQYMADEGSEGYLFSHENSSLRGNFNPLLSEKQWYNLFAGEHTSVSQFNPDIEAWESERYKGNTGTYSYKSYLAENNGIFMLTDRDTGSTSKRGVINRYNSSCSRLDYTLFPTTMENGEKIVGPPVETTIPLLSPNMVYQQFLDVILDESTSTLPDPNYRPIVLFRSKDQYGSSAVNYDLSVAIGNSTGFDVASIEEASGYTSGIHANAADGVMLDNTISVAFISAANVGGTPDGDLCDLKLAVNSDFTQLDNWQTYLLDEFVSIGHVETAVVDGDIQIAYVDLVYVETIDGHPIYKERIVVI